MIKKTYKTFSLKRLNLLLINGEGKRIEVVFRGGIHVDSTAKFSTANPDIQDKLEKCSGFGRDYYLDESVEVDAPVSPPANAVKEPAPGKKKELMAEYKDIKRFRNLVEMKNYIKELGIELADDANYLQSKAAAAKAGYDFQIQK